MICIFRDNKDTIKHIYLYNNQINAGALIGQSAMVYCHGGSKLMEKSRVFWIIIQKNIKKADKPLAKLAEH